MLLNHMFDVIDTATGEPSGTAASVVRYLRPAGLVAGKGLVGGAAPEATVRDVVRILLAQVSGIRRTEAVADLARTSGLVADVDGREQSLPAKVEQLVEQLIDNGDLGDVVDVRIAISRPWPSAILSMGFADLRVVNLTFHHRDARRDGSADQIRRLAKRWGYLGPGSSAWSVLELSALKVVADAMAGRTEAAEEPVPVPPAGVINALANLPAGFGVFARARTGPPAPAEGARRARRRKS